MSIIFVKEKFQYLKHSLQKRMVYHSNQLRKAIINLWQRGYSYSNIVDAINNSAIAKISKGTVAYQVKKFQETNSVETMKKSGRPRSVRTLQLRNSTRAKIVRNQKRSQRFWLNHFESSFVIHGYISLSGLISFLIVQNFANKNHPIEQHK